MNAKIEVRNAGNGLAYIATIGINNISSSYDRLIKWATPKGLITDKTKMITVYHDSLKVTEANKARTSAGILLHEPLSMTEEIGLRKIESQKCIVAHYEIGIHKFEKAWTSLFIWMKDQGYEKANSEPFEIYHNNFNEHPERIAFVDFCIPVN